MVLKNFIGVNMYYNKNIVYITFKMSDAIGHWVINWSQINTHGLRFIVLSVQCYHCVAQSKLFLKKSLLVYGRISK